jgi:hypothetical protein
MPTKTAEFSGKFRPTSILNKDEWERYFAPVFLATYLRWGGAVLNSYSFGGIAPSRCSTK